MVAFRREAGPWRLTAGGQTAHGSPRVRSPHLARVAPLPPHVLRLLAAEEPAPEKPGRPLTLGEGLAVARAVRAAGRRIQAARAAHYGLGASAPRSGRG